MNHQAINFQQKFALFAGPLATQGVAEMSGYQSKLARPAGDFAWHAHADTDEAFIVLEGGLRIDFRDSAVEPADGEMFVVPKGVGRKSSADGEAEALLAGPHDVVNSGRTASGLTARNDVWIQAGPDPAHGTGVPP
jgi:mannose-6-phosphate isomerase-like protein (cupin superfamily)